MSIHLQNVSVAIGGEKIIDNVDVALQRGTMNVLLGATLAGKTSLMRLMAGLDQPTSGKILVDGADVTGVPVRKRSVAMVYQQFVNYPSLSVYENIASPLRVAKVKADEVERRVHEAAKVLGLEPFLKRQPSQLSGGQQQRTAIARALTKRADLVLLDEPLANLDYKLREELREELPRILSQTGATLVYATTEPLEALQLGGNTATLWQGRLIQFGPSSEVYHRPSNIESARVFSDPPLNEIPIVKAGGEIRFGDSQTMPALGTLARIADGNYTVAFRADIVSLRAAWPQSLTFAGEISVAEISGSESFVHVTSPLGTFVCVEPGVSTLQPGQRADVHVDATRVFVFDSAGALVVADREQ